MSKTPARHHIDDLQTRDGSKTLRHNTHLFQMAKDMTCVFVTGSSRLDTYRRVGDSLMDRYFLYHMHPFSVAEIVHRDLPDSTRIVRLPKKPKAVDFNALWQHGG